MSEMNERLEVKIEGKIKDITDEMIEIKEGIIQELGVRIDGMEERMEHQMKDRLGEFEMKLVTQFGEMEKKNGIRI